jgi:putative acetyltransferase
MNGIEIRKIRSSDNKDLAEVIRSTLVEFKANKPGTVYFDESTDRLSDVFETPGSVYYVALLNNKIIGGAGVFPTRGLPADTCELVKMYLRPEARGKGLGKELINSCFEFARKNGYKKMYLETMPELKTAIGMYEKSGFALLSSAMGDSGHHGCDLWMLKEL